MSNTSHDVKWFQMVGTKENLKQTETKGYPLQNKKNKIISTHLKRFAYTIDG